jgi:citrate synthase
MVQVRSAARVTVASRNASSSSGEKDLKETLKEIIPRKREQLKKLKAEHGQKKLGDITVENALGGMRFVGPGPGIFYPNLTTYIVV